VNLTDSLAIGEILAGRGSWFGARLLRLIAKADPVNRDKLRKVYPAEVAAVERFQKGEEGAQSSFDFDKEGTA